MQISISYGNVKTGRIPSVSLPSIKTCRKDAPCTKVCYSRRYECRRPNVKTAYENNYREYLENPDRFWAQIDNKLKTSRFFRFHVAGDIPDEAYLLELINAAKRNKKCEIVCFTKKYEMVNKFIQESQTGTKAIPKNLHLIFSIWKELDYSNPYNLPEAHVMYKDNTTTASKKAFKCTGNCESCAVGNTGCWNLKFGQQVMFAQH